MVNSLKRKQTECSPSPATRPPPETMNVVKEAEQFLRGISDIVFLQSGEELSSRACDVWRDRLVALLDRQRVLALREAANHCEGQVISWESAQLDEYRRGQHRGAVDCVTVVTRLANALEGT